MQKNLDLNNPDIKTYIHTFQIFFNTFIIRNLRQVAISLNRNSGLLEARIWAIIQKKSTNYNKVSAKVIYCTTRPCFALMELVRCNLITITKSHCHDETN